MIKLKTILAEGFAWERKEGKGLPTMAEVKAEYDAKQLKENAGDLFDEIADELGLTPEEFDAALDKSRAELDGIERLYNSDSLTSTEALSQIADMLDVPFGYYKNESAKPDFLDLDKDGNETESMKSAAADSTDSGNYINKARAKSHLAKNDGSVYGIDGSGKGHPITNASDLDKYSKWTIKSDSMNEGFVSRIKKNLIGGDYRG